MNFNKDGDSDLSTQPLARAAIGTPVCIVSVDLDEEQATWLHAVGIGSGEIVSVLRRAALGGPIHVRTSSGGEFALAQSLAQCIRTRPAA